MLANFLTNIKEDFIVKVQDSSIKEIKKQKAKRLI